MEYQDKVVNLFSVYTILSLSISIVAWAAVGLGFISISTEILSGIGLVDWSFAFLVYSLGFYVVYKLYKYGNVNLWVFGAYLVIQATALIYAFGNNGWFFTPGAGSQGTIPAAVISASMLVYLYFRNNKNEKMPVK